METKRASWFFIMMFVIGLGLLAVPRIAAAEAQSQEPKETDQKLTDTDTKDAEASPELETGAEKEKEQMRKDLARAQEGRDRRWSEDRLDRRDTDRR